MNAGARHKRCAECERQCFSITHYELCTAEDEPSALDLSVFGTTADVSDEDIIEGWNADNLAYTSIDKATELWKVRTPVTDYM